jgi:hypothetical protein
MRWIAFVVTSAAAALAFAVACSGGGDVGAPESIDGAVPDASSTGDGAPPGPPDERILPLAEGRRWTYDTHPVDGGRPTPCVGPQTAEVLGPGNTYDGGPSLRYKPLCAAPIPFVDVVGTDDHLVAYILNDAGVPTSLPVLYIDGPVEEGHQWSYNPSVRFEWRDAGPQTVPAGTFTDCWVRVQVSPADPADSVIYCRGVGQVRHFSPDFTAELSSKTF